MSSIEIQNQKRYLKAPTLEQINSVIEHFGVTAKQFERFFNIYPNCIAQLRMKEKSAVYSESSGCSYERKLPKKYWHIIYENLPSKKNVIESVKAAPTEKPKIKRAKKKKVVVDEKILALL